MAYQPQVDSLAGSWAEMDLAIVETVGGLAHVGLWEPTQRLVELEEEHHHAINVFIEGVGRAHGDSQGHARGVGHGRVRAGGRDIDGVRGIQVKVEVVVATVIHGVRCAHGCN